MASSSAWIPIGTSRISLAKSRRATSSRWCLLEEGLGMLKKANRFGAFLFLLGLLSATTQAAVPDWLRSAAQQPAKKYADDANAVVLLQDEETTVKDSGEIVAHTRIVFKILRPEGKDYAQYSVDFDAETRINSFRGWSLTAKGQEYEARERDAFEHSLGGQREFDDTKEK